MIFLVSWCLFFNLLIKLPWSNLYLAWIFPKIHIRSSIFMKYGPIPCHCNGNYALNGLLFKLTLLLTLDSRDCIFNFFFVHVSFRKVLCTYFSMFYFSYSAWLFNHVLIINHVHGWYSNKSDTTKWMQFMNIKLLWLLSLVICSWRVFLDVFCKIANKTLILCLNVAGKTSVPHLAW